jgi:hypothetical protein
MMGDECQARRPSDRTFPIPASPENPVYRRLIRPRGLRPSVPEPHSGYRASSASGPPSPHSLLSLSAHTAHTSGCSPESIPQNSHAFVPVLPHHRDRSIISVRTIINQRMFARTLWNPFNQERTNEIHCSFANDASFHCSFANDSSFTSANDRLRNVANDRSVNNKKLRIAKLHDELA